MRWTASWLIVASCGGDREREPVVLKEPAETVRVRDAAPPDEPKRRVLRLPDIMPAGVETNSSLDANGRFRCVSGYHVEPAADSAGCQGAGYDVAATVLFTFEPDATTATRTFVDKLVIQHAPRPCDPPRLIKDPPAALRARLVPELGARAPSPTPKLEANICRDPRVTFEVTDEVVHNVEDWIHVFRAFPVPRAPVRLLVHGREVARWDVGSDDLPDPCRKGNMRKAPRFTFVKILCTADLAIVSSGSYRNDSTECDARGALPGSAAAMTRCDASSELAKFAQAERRLLRVNLADATAQPLVAVEQPTIEIQ